MTDATDNNENLTPPSVIETEPATWEFEGNTYPLFPFDKPCEVKLLNGTIHRFKLWTPAIEKKREDLLKSIVVSSPAVINGQNPMDVKTDATRSLLAYYDLMIDEVGGVTLNGFDQNGAFQKANKVIEGELTRKGTPARIVDMISPAVRRAAVQRLYSGKIEVEKPEAEEQEVDYDPFASTEDFDLQKEIDKQTSQQRVYTLAVDRSIVIRQQLGIEQLPSGQFTEPTHFLRYHFNDPEGEDFSRWEMKAQKGFVIQTKGGGTRGESYYNLETLNALFDKLINKIEGASLNNVSIELPADRNSDLRKAILAQVPLHIKKMTCVRVFQEAGELGNA